MRLLQGYQIGIRLCPHSHLWSALCNTPYGTWTCGRNKVGLISPLLCAVLLFTAGAPNEVPAQGDVVYERMNEGIAVVVVVTPANKVWQKRYEVFLEPCLKLPPTWTVSQVISIIDYLEGRVGEE